MSVGNGTVLEGSRGTYVALAIGALVGLSLLYTIVLAQPLLPVIVAWVGIVLSVVMSVVMLYLFWRVVRAFERIADSME